MLTFGNQDQNSAIISVKSYKFFKRIVFGGDIGFANAYITGEWFTNNLEAIFQLFIENAHLTNQKNIISSLSKLTYRIKHAYRKNSLTNSKKNIFEHYDLGNDFFQLFLDQHRVYSSGIFKTNEDSLETAQINKIEQALNLADVKPSHKILEIGSGWGALAIYAAQTIGCHVTTVTISEEQYNFVKKKINRLHLDDKIEVKLMDYRHLEGKYDRIVSIEMLEAVGHQYLPVFFKNVTICSRLKEKLYFNAL